MYKIMILFRGLEDWEMAETGYETDNLEEADAKRNELLKLNPAANFVVC